MSKTYRDLSEGINEEGWSKWQFPLLDRESGVQHYRTACCDCGLVHHIAFYVDSTGEVAISFKRDNRRTGQVRRWRDHPCKEA